MSTELFRREAIDHQRRRVYGEVALTPPLPVWMITALVSTLVASAIAALLLASYARKETVVGWVTPDKGLARISAATYAVIEAVHISEGAVVEKGAPLLTLTQDAGLGSGFALVETLLAELAREEGALIVRRTLAQEQAAAARADLAARRGNVVAEIAELRAQSELQQARLELAKFSWAIRGVGGGGRFLAARGRHRTPVRSCGNARHEGDGGARAVDRAKPGTNRCGARLLAE